VISQGKVVALDRWGGKWNHLSMTHRLATNYAKNYCNRTLMVKVIVENVVTCFFWTRCSFLTTNRCFEIRTGSPVASNRCVKCSGKLSPNHSPIANHVATDDIGWTSRSYWQFWSCRFPKVYKYSMFHIVNHFWTTGSIRRISHNICNIRKCRSYVAFWLQLKPRRNCTCG